MTTWQEVLFMTLTLFALSCRLALFREDHVASETISSGSIQRVHFVSHEELYVWVNATNQHGSAISQKVVFNTADISESALHMLIYEYRTVMFRYR